MRISRRSLAAIGATVLGHRLPGGDPAGRSGLEALVSLDSFVPATPSAGARPGGVVGCRRTMAARPARSDFFDVHQADDEWPEARASSCLGRTHDPLLGEDLPLRDPPRSVAPAEIGERGIALAVNVTGATGAQCADHPERLSHEVAAIQHLVDLGADISFLSLQSPLSKVRGSCPAYGKETGYDLRIADIVRYVGHMTERFPGIEFGLVDAIPAKGWDYQDVYLRLLDDLASQGLGLAFIHLEFPDGVRLAGGGPMSVRSRILYVATSGFRSGSSTSPKSVALSRTWRSETISWLAYRAYRAAGSPKLPDHLELTSWYAFPDLHSA